MRKSFAESLALALQLGFIIVIPLLVLAVSGRMLDRKYHSHPWLFLAGIGLAFILSSLMIFRKIIQIYKDLDQEQ